MPFDAFISYSSIDKTIANAACAALESAGIRCWMAPRDVRPGLEYAESIIEGIDSCRIMVLIFSSNANASQQVHREIERAVSKGLTIVPFRIEDIPPTKAMEYYLGSIHWLDALTPPLARHLQQLIETIKVNLQLDPGVSTDPRRVPPKIDGSAPGSSKMRLLTAGAVALVLMGAGGLAILGVRGGFSNLFGRTEVAPTPVQQILLNVLRASNDEPLGFSWNIPNEEFQKPISLRTLDDAIRGNYPAELLYWLFTDSFELQLFDHQFGYRYNPPVDYGCSKIDPKYRCYIDWVRIAALTGLTVEEKTVQKSGTFVYARFCFSKVRSAEAQAAMPPEQIRAELALLDVVPSLLFSSLLNCGSTAWAPSPDDPVSSSAQSYLRPLVLTPPGMDATISMTLVPRSIFGAFQFLGTVLKAQRAFVPAFLGAIAKVEDDPIQPDVDDSVPTGQIYAKNPPTLVTVHDDPMLWTVVPNANKACFVEVRYKDIEYCVPDEASTTKRIIGFLMQLTGAPSSPAQ